ncbi:MAG TPA: hypothetical protein VEX60_01250 [Pyrinomonadaceae bacterium]|nr:hypothetical protein [Pyrinomonadaceae bacterium]
MKDTRNTFSRLLVSMALVAACFATFARAQNREEYFISARAGGVNFVSGDVAARRAGEKEWRQLSIKDSLRSGDTVRAAGRVELLLNPGSYLRAGDGAEIELTNASLDNLQIKLLRGGAIIEATGYDGLDISIAVMTPQTRMRIVRSGLYRLNVLPSGVTEVAVQKGRAIIAGEPETLVKGGKVARVGAGGVEIVKFDKKNRDELDFWSRERGHELAKINDKLANRNTNALLARTSFDSMFSASNRFDPFGLWFWSAQNNCYTFLPFYAGYRSPYGFWYGSSFNPFGSPWCGSCRLRRDRRDQRPIIVNSTPTVTYNPGGTSNGGTSTGGIRPSGGAPMPAPPPRTVDRRERIGGRERPSQVRPRDQ